jgi:outer membrane murein-binding lipoprotein Lpp
MRLGIFLASMLMVLVFVGCSNEASKPEANEASKPEANEASKLEAEVLSPDTFAMAKSACKASSEAFGANTSLGECVDELFLNQTDKFCKNKGFEPRGTTCLEARKRVRQRLREYLANPPKLSGDK